MTLTALLLVLCMTACGKPSVTDFTVDAEQRLVVMLSDGRFFNLGRVTKTALGRLSYDTSSGENMFYLIRDSIGSPFSQYLAGCNLKDLIDVEAVLDAKAPEAAVACYLDGLPAYREELSANIEAFYANAK